MRETYADVISAVGRPPVWWDWHGGPHYCVPEECKVHRWDLYAFRRIRCQECSRMFRVLLIGPYGNLWDLHPVLDLALVRREDVPVEILDAVRQRGWWIQAHRPRAIETFDRDGIQDKREAIPDDWHYGDPPFHGDGVLGSEDACTVGYSMSSIAEYEWQEFWPDADHEELYCNR